MRNNRLGLIPRRSTACQEKRKKSNLAVKNQKVIIWHCNSSSSIRLVSNHSSFIAHWFLLGVVSFNTTAIAAAIPAHRDLGLHGGTVGNLTSSLLLLKNHIVLAEPSQPFLDATIRARPLAWWTGVRQHMAMPPCFPASLQDCTLRFDGAVCQNNQPTLRPATS